MTLPTFGTVARVLEREQGTGRPLIVPADGGEPVPYDRASSYGKSIDDGFGLKYWSMCMVAKGMSLSPALVRGAKPLDYYGGDKGKLHEIAEKAMDKAGSSDRAIDGTAMHAYTDLIDGGKELPEGVDDETLASLEAYRQITDGLEVVAMEQFVVCDEARAAGSFDRLLRVPSCPPWPEWVWGKLVIGDLKTGNAEAAIAEIAIQLAIYAHGDYYDIATGERTPTGADPDLGLVIHLPFGERKAQIIALNLKLGWQGVFAAQAARAYQNAAKLTCGSCKAGARPGYYKNGNPCKSCKGVGRVPIGITIRAAAA